MLRDSGVRAAGVLVQRQRIRYAPLWLVRCDQHGELEMGVAVQIENPGLVGADARQRTGCGQVTATRHAWRPDGVPSVQPGIMAKHAPTGSRTTAYRNTASDSVTALMTAPPLLLDATEALIGVADGQVDEPDRREAEVGSARVADAGRGLPVAAGHAVVVVLLARVFHLDVEHGPAHDVDVEIAGSVGVGDGQVGPGDPADAGCARFDGRNRVRGDDGDDAERRAVGIEERGPVATGLHEHAPAQLAGASALLGLLLPTATGFVFRTVVPSGDGSQLALVFMGLLAAGFGAAAFDLTRAFVILRMNGKTAITMEAALFDRMLKLPTTFFRRYTIGDLVSRMNGIGMIRTLLSGTAVAAILGLMTGAFNFILMFWYDWKLALVATGFALLSAAFLAACTWASIRHQKAIQELTGRISGLVVQMLSGIAKLRIAGAEDRALATWSSVYAQNVRARDRAARVQAFVAVFNDALPLMNSLVIFGGVGLIASRGWGRIDTAAFMAFNTAMGIFLTNAIATANTVVNTAQVVPLFQRAKPILVTEPEVPQGKPNPGELSGEIEGKHLSFRYHADGPLILDDVSFSAASGEFIALVGPSGSGKSTTLRLLLGFETAETGAIYFDGKDLADIDVSAVRRQMGVVLQTSRVMSGSIFKNIVGSSPLTEADAWEAAEMAGLADDIRTMPMQMHTVVSEGGSTLSGGQRQRLLVARALVRKPRIILFDEATSALDNQTQQIVSDSLDRIHATRFVIAHRLSTIRNADRIYVMERGRILESGSYDELMATQGMFARLARRQLA